MTTPLSFITIDTNIVFKDENDENTEKTGVISSFEEVTTDERGTYVQCNIINEEGNYVAKLYDDDFNNDSSDKSWKFYGMNNLLVKKILEFEQILTTT
jgi:hypothetical protein